MAKLEDLYYEILFKDNTSSGIKAIEDKLKRLNTTLSVGIDASTLEASIQKALNGKSYTIKVNAGMAQGGLSQQMTKAVTDAATQAAKATEKATKRVTKSTTPTDSKFFGDYERYYKTISKGGGFDGVTRQLESQITSMEAKMESLRKKMAQVHIAPEERKTNPYLAGLQSQYDALKRSAESAYATLAKFERARTVTTVTNLPTAGTIVAKAERQAAAQVHAQRKSDITAAFAEQAKKEEAAQKAVNAQLAERERLQKRIVAVQEKINSAKSQLPTVNGQAKKDLKDYIRSLEKVKVGIGTARNTNGLSGFASDLKITRELQKAEESYRAAKVRTAQAEREDARAKRAASQAAREAASAARAQARAQREVAESMRNVKSAGAALRDTLAGIFSVYAAKEFLMNIIQIGGEFEKQKLALAAMFNSTTRADVLYSKLQSLAVESPFTFQELSSFTKQLAAYGIEYNNVYDDVKRLADISAGVGVPMSRIILAYGQVSTATYLRASELKQFTEAGIPLVQALADRFTELNGQTVRAADVFKMISERAVSFEDVRAVLHDMTDEGGRFANMQRTLAESLSGRWANFVDSIEIMYSEIEDANKGWMKSVLQGITSIVRNWKMVVAAVTPVITLYGMLKAAQLAAWVSGEGVNRINAKIASSSVVSADAVNRETEAYQRLATAVNAEGISMTKAQKAALYRAGVLAAARGANGQIIAASAPTVFSNMGYAQTRRNMEAQNSGKKFSRLANAFNRFKLGGNLGTFDLIDRKLRMLDTRKEGISKKLAIMSLKMRREMLSMSAVLSSIGAGFMSLINPATIANGTIMGVVSALTYFKQKSDEIQRSAEDAARGMKQTYEEVRNFLDANPIHTVVKSGNPAELRETLKAYEEEIRNAPIDMSFALIHAGVIDDVSDKLVYLRNKLEELRDIAGNNQTTSTTTEAISDATDGWFDDSVGTNVQDYDKALRKFSLAADKINRVELSKVMKSWDKEVGELSKGMDKAVAQKFAAAFQNLKTAMSLPNASNEIIARMLAQMAEANRLDFSHLTFGKTNLRESIWNAVDQSNGNNWFTDVLSQFRTLESDIDRMASVVKNKLEQDFGVGIMSNMSDAAYIRMKQIVQETAGYYKLNEEQAAIMLSSMEQRAVAAANSTWNVNRAAYTKIIGFLKLYYPKVFDGADLKNGFNESQKGAIQLAIANLPTHMLGYKTALQKELNNMGSDLVLNIKMNFIKQNGGDQDSEASGLYDKYISTLRTEYGGRPGVLSQLDALSPKSGQSASEFVESLQEQLKRNAKELKAYEGLNKQTDETQKTLEGLKDKRDAISGMLKSVSNDAYQETQDEINKKDNTRNNKENSEANKLEQNELKRLRNRLSRLKDYKSTFEKIQKYFGDQGAIDQLKTSGLFASGFAPDTLRSEEDVDKWIQEQLTSLKNDVNVKSSEERNALSDDIVKWGFELKLELNKKGFDREMKAFEAELKRVDEEWARFKAFEEVGMTQPQTVMLTFGDGRSRTNKADDLKRQIGELLEKKGVFDILPEDVIGKNEQELNDLFGNDPRIVDSLKQLVEAYKEASKSIREEYDKMYQEMWEKAKGYAEKIADLQRKYDNREKAIVAGEQLFVSSGGKKGISPETATRMRAANNIELQEETGKIKMEQLRNSAHYLNFFNAVLTMTGKEAIAAANTLRDELTQKLRDGSISAKDYADEIEKINGQLDKNFGQKSDARTLLTGGLSALIQKRIEKAQERRSKASNAYDEAEEAYNEAMKVGNERAMSDAAKTMKKAKKDMDEASKDEDKNRGRKADADAVAELVEQLEQITQHFGELRDSIGEMMESFGTDIENSEGFQKFSTAVDVMGSAIGGVQGVVKNLMNGDLMGAFTSVVTAPLSIITAFNKLHDKKLDIQIKQSEKRSKEIERAAAQISTAIENSLGWEASKENALESYKQLSEQGEALGIKSWSKSYNLLYKLLDGSLSGADLMNERSAYSKIATAVGEAIGRNVFGADSFRMSETAKALKAEGFDTAESISAYGAQYAALLLQREELERQYALENQKKDSDSDKLDDYKDKLSELNEEISQFKVNLLKNLYDIDFSSWADTLAHSLVNAFAEGQDAAEAFTSSVNDLMKSVVKNVISQAVLMPWLNSLQEQVESLYDLNDESSIEKVIKLIYDSAMTEGQKRVEAAEKIFNAYDQMMGGGLSESSSSSSISGSAKQLTEEEETGSLLVASYLNAIRADVSIQRELLARLASDFLPTTNALLEGQVVQLSQIARNTDLIVQNTAACNELVGDIRDQVRSVVTVGSGGKAVRIK